MAGRHAKPRQRFSPWPFAAAAFLLLQLADFSPAATTAPLPETPAAQTFSSAGFAASPTPGRDGYGTQSYFYHWPLSCPPIITDDTGPRLSPGGIGSTSHNGTDLVCDLGGAPDDGQPILAIANGVVEAVSSGDGYGNKVIISHEVNGEAFTSVYAHLAWTEVWAGEQVSLGQQIGGMGNTGSSAGTHLHLEIHISGNSASTSAAEFFAERSSLTYN